MTIDEAIIATQKGNRAAFSVVYDHFVEPLYRFIYYKTFSKETAEDLLSDVFMRALEHVDRYDPAKGSLSAWLYQIARNRVIDHYRTKRTTVPIDDTFDLGFEERTAERYDAKVKLDAIHSYLTHLPVRQREIIMLRVWEELSYREIADLVGGSEGSVKMAFSRAIGDIRERYGDSALILLAAGVVTLPFAIQSYSTYI